MPLGGRRCRTEIRKKIALFASLPAEAIVSACDVDNIYKVPLTFREQGVDDFILEHFGQDEQAPAPDLSRWQEPIERCGTRDRSTVRIALVGKYVQLEDAYLSVSEALRHAASLQDGRVEIEWIDSESLESGGEDEVARQLGGVDGILIPGGFGGRGIEGKIARRAVRARARRSRIWASASACRSPSPSSRATSPAWRARTRPSSTSRRPTR